MSFKITSKNHLGSLRDTIMRSVNKTMQLALEDLLWVTQDTIKQYNTGFLERFPGDYENRYMKFVSTGYNLPLIQSGDMIRSFSYVIEDKPGVLLGTITTNVDYFKDIDEGKDSIIAYNISSIAMDRAKTAVASRFRNMRFE